jgi:integrase
MANPSYWTFKRGSKWYSGWRDERGRCHSKVHPIGAGKAMAYGYARQMAVEAVQVRAGHLVRGKDVCAALETFLARENVKPCTHDLNRRHLESFLDHCKIRDLDQLTEDVVHLWLGHLKAIGNNPGGQSLSLRILRTFSRFCLKKKWIAAYPFESFKIPKSEFVGQYLTDEQRDRLLSIDPRYESVDIELNRALTFGLYSLLRISQVFNADWSHFKMPDQLWIPGIKGQDGRWIRLHPKALDVMGPPRETGQIFSRWETLAAFRESVYKKAKREKLKGVRFHETKHTGISALLEAGYSVPEVCKISGNSYRTIAHYAHVNEARVFEKWKGFDYSRKPVLGVVENRTATVQQNEAKCEETRAQEGARALQGENAKRIDFAASS